MCNASPLHAILDNLPAYPEQLRIEGQRLHPTEFERQAPNPQFAVSEQTLTSVRHARGRYFGTVYLCSHLKWISLLQRWTEIVFLWTASGLTMFVSLEMSTYDASPRSL